METHFKRGVSGTCRPICALALLKNPYFDLPRPLAGPTGRFTGQLYARIPSLPIVAIIKNPHTLIIFITASIISTSMFSGEN